MDVYCYLSFMLLYVVLSLLLIYALFGSPTPDQFSWVEVVIGVGFIGVFLASGWKNLLRHRKEGLLFFALLFFPSIIGIVMGHSLQDYVRDIIPLFFLFLPYFFPDIEYKRLSLCVASVGVIFSIRFFSVSAMPLHLIGEQQAGGDNLLYLASSPTVPFAAIFCVLMSLSDQRCRLLKRVFFMLSGGIAFAALAATVQRATLVLGLLMVALYVCHVCRHSPKKMLCLGLVGVFVLVVVGEQLFGTLGMIYLKTLKVFDNSRLAELQSVVLQMSYQPESFLWGQGWGATFFSPAAGYNWVRYTHTLFSYALFKAGFIGLVLMVLYVKKIMQMLFQVLFSNYVLVLSVLPSLSLGLTLYPSFKMLGFGLLLWVLKQAARGKNDAKNIDNKSCLSP